MSCLDDAETLARYDVSGMLSLVESFPEQCIDAERIGRKFKLPRSFKTRYSNIVLTGMGGSAIGMDILRSYISDDIDIPVTINRNYTVPRFANNRSLVIVSSYSGNTEETLSAYSDAKRKKARILVVTSGGKLQGLARRDNHPVILIPRGLPPRCALGYSSITLLAVMEHIGLAKIRSGDFRETIKVLTYLRDKRIGHKIPGRTNIAKAISARIYRKYPVVYASQEHLDAVLTRWRGELAENAKTLTSGHLFPEMNHNEIVGWENPEEILKHFIVIMLEDRGDHPRNKKRMKITAEILMEKGVEVLKVASLGKGLLSRILSLAYIGDFVSFYLAILNKTDPTPVERIALLKERMARS